MTTLEELKAEVDHLRDVVLMADSDSVEAKQILRSHTGLLNAIRLDQRDLANGQHALRQMFYEQGQAFGEMLLTLLRFQDRLNSVGSDVIDLKKDMTLLNQRQGRMEERQERTEQRLTRMEERQDRMDRNIVAIMGHLGVDSPDEP